MSSDVINIYIRRMWNNIRTIERAYWILPIEDRGNDLVQFVADGLVSLGYTGRGSIITGYDPGTDADRLYLAMKKSMDAFLTEHARNPAIGDDVQLWVSQQLVNDGWVQK